MGLANKIAGRIPALLRVPCSQNLVQMVLFRNEATTMWVKQCWCTDRPVFYHSERTRGGRNEEGDSYFR